MVLINNLTAYTIFRAFIINAIITALISSLVVTIRIRMKDKILKNEDSDFFIDKINNFIFNVFDLDKDYSQTDKFQFLFILSTITAFVIYVIMYLLIGFGGGMISSKKVKGFF
jgi:hypothetical protein